MAADIKVLHASNKAIRKNNNLREIDRALR
jgi:hypothetical protein